MHEKPALRHGTDRGRFCVLRLKMRELLKIKSVGHRTQNTHAAIAAHRYA